MILLAQVAVGIASQGRCYSCPGGDRWIHPLPNLAQVRAVEESNGTPGLGLWSGHHVDGKFRLPSSRSCYQQQLRLLRTGSWLFQSLRLVSHALACPFSLSRAGKKPSVFQASFRDGCVDHCPIQRAKSIVVQLKNMSAFGSAAVMPLFLLSHKVLLSSLEYTLWVPFKSSENKVFVPLL
uniref:Uncharacterized protein n=1 Tax=Sphaerodactylus townsendi TaxID=933632 RepID=A0ACB8FLR0_9SAUR